MRYLFLFLIFLSIDAFAENKVYFDKSKNIEIIDVSGLKDIDKIRQECDCDPSDVTQASLDKEKQDRVSNEEILEKEGMIKKELRDFAIDNLKKSGHLDSDGNVKKNK